jgi:hydroxymethylbilane synthase
MEEIGGSCTTPLAAYARWEGGSLRLDALVASPDGARVLRHAGGTTGAPRDLGREVAGWMLARGAAEIVRQGEAA